MKYCSSSNMTTQNESEVESLLMSPCWSQGQNGSQDQYMLEGHKLLLEHDLDSLPSDSETQKGSIDVLDNLLLNSQSINSSLAELKPLPPFTGYTGHLSINGISGHHYHAIAQRLPEENNNYSQSTYQASSGGASTTDQNIVSSSTCLPDSVLNPDAPDTCLQDVKLFSDSAIDSKMYVADSCVMSGSGGSGPDSVSSVRIYADSKDLTEYDMSSIEDIAAIIGSAIADTTVPNQIENDDNADTRDSWMDLDAWIDGACVQQDGKLIVAQQDSMNEFILPHSPGVQATGSTLQSLLTHGYMPLLQNRLQNGPPIKVEAPTSSTSYCGDLISTSTSPPGSVVSTTDNMMLNGRYLSNQQSHHYQVNMTGSSGGGSGGGSGIKSDGLCSPELMGNYPHTTTTSTPTSAKNKRSRSQKKSQQQGQLGAATTQASAVSYQASSDLSGLLSKEKPVHRCNICNRGFLNKSNIKVHLRTHTGEKPFRCEVCSKAFRQKAHLIKHQQIHKRIGRD
ncbi:ichor [Lutzomyia longipalpis]|uniref:ichor n=1 Tax=Lutzomyia longipalpis TaxID=7200 RepID=UPI0024846D93|nr:ichor [Lutzomyia longipalpis]XP_055677491.1 ichor [Lutzomyia longipalpis]